MGCAHGRCDKTTPALLMGAASCGLRRSQCQAADVERPLQGREVGSGTDIWRFGEEVKAGRMRAQEFLDAERACRARRALHDHGTASTMGRW